MSQPHATCRLAVLRPRAAAVVGALLLGLACAKSGEPDKAPEKRISLTPPVPEPLAITRGIRDKPGSLATGVIDALKSAASSPTPPRTFPGPATRAADVPRTIEALAREAEEQIKNSKNTPIGQATDADVQRLIEALKKTDVNSDYNKAVDRLVTRRGMPELSLAPVASEVRHGRIGWYFDDINTALEDAQHRSQPLVLVFCEDLDLLCGQLAREVMPCPAVNRFAGHATFVWLRPSYSWYAKNLAEQYKLEAFPVITVVTSADAKYTRQGQQVGLLAAEPLADYIGSVIQGGTVEEAAALARDQRLFNPANRPTGCGKIVFPRAS